MMKKTYLLLFAFLVLMNGLYAGVKLVTKIESKGCTEETGNGQTTMYLRADIMRMDIEDGENKLGIIYKQSEQKMWILDHAKKSFQSITKEDLEKINAKFEQMKKAMEEQMKNMPEDQKEKMMRMMSMGDMGMFTEQPKIEYVKKDEEKTISKWPCGRYDQLQNDKLSSVYWVTSLENMKVSKEDFSILRDFSTFLQESFSFFSFGSSSFMISPEQSFDGFPIASSTIEEGKECTTSTVQSVEQTKLNNEMFQIPDGYRREENPLKGR